MKTKARNKALQTQFIMPEGFPEPAFFHIRLQDEEGAVSALGGATGAFYLIPEEPDGGGEAQVVAHVALSVCSEEDNFNKRIGRQIALSRLAKLFDGTADEEDEDLDDEDTADLSEEEDDEAFEDQAHRLYFRFPLVQHRSPANIDPFPINVLATVGEKVFLSIREEDFPVVTTLVRQAMVVIQNYRLHTYEGDDQDVLDSIEEMFSVMSDDEDGPAWDDTEQGDGEENEEGDEDDEDAGDLDLNIDEGPMSRH